jgi:RNA polymerase sigma-70 factor (ECF subfamily)
MGEGTCDEKRAAEAACVIAALLADLDVGFALAMRTYGRLVYTVTLRLTGHRADAEDLAAEAFTRAYRALRSYEPDRIARLAPRPWLATIAANVARNERRDAARRPIPSELTPGPARVVPTIGFDEGVTVRDTRERLDALLAQLPRAQRDAVVLRHVAELSTSEVAATLRIAEGTVKSNVARGLQRLRALAIESGLEEEIT